MSFNPATGLVYIPTSAPAPLSTSRSTSELRLQAAGEEPRALFGQASQPAAAAGDAAGATAASPRHHQASVTARDRPRAASAQPARDSARAWDPVKQKERWHTIGGGGIGGGTVTTAGNLVFQVIPDGRLVAYRADTGEKLLDIKTGLRGGMGPPA